MLKSLVKFSMDFEVVVLSSKTNDGSDDANVSLDHSEDDDDEEDDVDLWDLFPEEVSEPVKLPSESK